RALGCAGHAGRADRPLEPGRRRARETGGIRPSFREAGEAGAAARSAVATREMTPARENSTSSSAIRRLEARRFAVDDREDDRTGSSERRLSASAAFAR